MQPFVPKWYKRRVVKKQWAYVKALTHLCERRELDRHDRYWPKPPEVKYFEDEDDLGMVTAWMEEEGL